MSKDWPQDIYDMHVHYGFHEAVEGLGPSELRALLDFRADFIAEELRELRTATSPEDVVDALIDICVVAIGTLDLYGADAHLAWDAVHRANMGKRVGVKESRPNPLGLPDLVKPEGWSSPSHEGNIGLLDRLDEEDETPPDDEIDLFVSGDSGC